MAIALTGPQDVLWVSVFLAIAGFAIGIQLPTALVAAQNAVPMRHLGIATASISFFRSLGGAVGIALLGAVLLALLHQHAPSFAASMTGQEMMRELISQAATAADPIGHAALLHGVEKAFRQLLYISAAVSMLSVPLCALVREQPLRGPAPTTAE